MTSEAARKILAIYRPTIDGGDPQFADALAQAERDPELARWLQEQGAIYETIIEYFGSYVCFECLGV